MAVSVTFKSNLEEVMPLFNSAKSRALRDIGIAIQGDARENSPVRTGALRRSWTVEVEEAESYVVIGVPVDELDGNYAKYVELGTTKQKANHMLGNAVNARKGEFKGITETEMKNA